MNEVYKKAVCDKTLNPITPFSHTQTYEGAHQYEPTPFTGAVCGLVIPDLLTEMSDSTTEPQQSNEEESHYTSLYCTHH